MMQFKQNSVALHYRIVSPMFLGGYEHQADDIRPASIKGMLRFWWRAENWGKIWRDRQDNVSQALADLHREECRLFGHAAADDVGGQGCFLLKVETHTSKNNSSPLTTIHASTSYMLGQGLSKWDSKQKKTILLREPIKGIEAFTVKLLFKPNVKSNDRQSILNAAKTFGLLGGLGSRSRRGFGSVTLETIEGDDNLILPTSVDNYKEMVKQLIQQQEVSLPPFSAFSGEAKLCETVIEEKEAEQVIQDIGLRMGSFRSCGRIDANTNKRMAYKQEVNLEQHRFKTDHDRMYHVQQGVIVDHAPERLIFGMPHNYHFSKGKDVQIQQTQVPDHEPLKRRRASPLFIHVHKIADQYYGLQFVLPAIFLPEGERVVMEGKRSQNVLFQAHWTLFDEYFQFVKNFKRLNA